jgi:hypothetical protein
MAKRAGELRKFNERTSTRESNISLVYKFLKEGKSIKWIEDFFLENQGLKPITVRLYLMDARRLIGTESEMDVDFASVLHDSRYETIWEQEKDIYLNWRPVPEEPWERAQNMEIVRRYSDLLKSLKQRENMYGLRDKDLMIALHSNISLTRDYKASSFEHHLKKYFDINKLSLEEKIELLALLKESYEGDLFSEANYVVENEEKEELKREIKVDNQKALTVKVEGIDQIKDQEEKPKKINLRKTSSILVKDLVTKEGLPIEEVSAKLEESQKKVIRIKFNKK